MEQKYIDALITSIVNEFPFDITQYIYNQLLINSPTFNINTLGEKFYTYTKVTIFETLLKLGYNINYQNTLGATLIMLVAQRGSTDAVKFLLSCGADISIKNKQCQDNGD